MSIGALVTVVLVAGGLIACILGVAALSTFTVVSGMVVVIAGLVVGVVSGRRYERDRRR